MTSMNDSRRRGFTCRRSRAALRVLGACSVLATTHAFAQNDGPPPGPGLDGSGMTFANDVERAAAAANQLVFRTLDEDCNPNGVLNQIPSPVLDDILGRLGGGAGPRCDPALVGRDVALDRFFVYLNARELVHNANELQGQGPTIASLGLDQEGLGLALRWTAAEELAAQGSMATEFANGQLSSLAARINALRFGATGFGTAGLYDQLRRSSPMVAQAGGGGEVDGGEQYSPWGGFLSYGFGYGSKAPTALEDAFDFDGSELTLGVDYRLRNNIVLGGIFGRTEQVIDFDEAASAISVVDGNIDADGDSFIFFGMSQGERLTVSGSIGVQSLDYFIQRNIQYPSFNPNTDSVHSLAYSEPTADVVTTTFSLGYAFNWTKFGLEPFVNIEHRNFSIDAFSEQRSINRLGNGDSRRFDLAVSEQEIESLRTSVGLRFQYVVTPRFGVIVPYWTIAAHRELEDESRTITTGYAALEDILGTNTFALSTDPPDESFFTASAGFSMVLRGGRQRQAGGPIAGGLMGYFQFSTVEGREHFDDRVITGGLRYEF
jgi:outer membrane lipase/esterase